MLLVIIIGLSVLFCVLFERKTFCRYLCPLAGMLGAYSTLSLLEVRGNKKVCQTQCGQHLCYKGTEKAEGCPMFSYPASLAVSTECMMCLNCLKSCDNRGVQVNLRPPLQEIWRQAQPMLSLSLFGVILVGLMARHQFSRTDLLAEHQKIPGLAEGLYSYRGVRLLHPHGPYSLRLERHPLGGRLPGKGLGKHGPLRAGLYPSGFWPGISPMWPMNFWMKGCMNF